MARYKRKGVPRSQKSRKASSVDKEIAKYQESEKLLIPKVPFARLVREILQGFCGEYRITWIAVEALQEASEDHIVRLFIDANLVAESRKCVTLKAGDLRVVKMIRANNRNYW